MPETLAALDTPVKAGTLTIAADYPSLCALVADQITALLHRKPNAVLGLATGSTPVGVYDLLVQRYRQGQLDFAGVTCFNLDEYYPMTAQSPHSYHAFMHEHLFRHVNCTRWFVPNGGPRSDAQILADCLDYEAKITDTGGIDLQLLGLGRTGHIGFNEPPSGRDTRTRRVTLAAETREDAAPGFGDLSRVPYEAVSMGVGTILEARRLVVMASGTGKAAPAWACWHGPVGAAVPASWVQTHPDAHLCLDRAAAALLMPPP